MSLGLVSLESLASAPNFAVHRTSAVVAGERCVFGVELVSHSHGDGFAEAPTLAWLEDESGKRLAEAAPVTVGEDRWTLELCPTGGTPHAFVVEAGGAKGRVPLYAGAAPRHGGVLTAVVVADAPCGFLEACLDGATGALEMYLTDLDHAPLRVAQNAFFAVKVPKFGRAVKLGLREPTENRDGSGTVTMVDGRTNYFVFPGTTGSDASWLTGLDWRASVEVRARADGRVIEAKPFVLVPREAL